MSDHAPGIGAIGFGEHQLAIWPAVNLIGELRRLLARVECPVERSVRIEPREVGTRDLIDRSKRAGNDNLPVQLLCQSRNVSVQFGMESRVNGAIRC